MTDAIIGFTGFVGGNLIRQHAFSDQYNSKNIDSLSGKRFDKIVCAAMPAAKWIANKHPEADRSALDKLLSNLRKVNCKTCILISTVDVYPNPQAVNEDTAIDTATLHPYGLHRLMLEQAVRDHFESVTILRLPGLFGHGLKKNAIYDFIHDNDIHNIHSLATYQFYHLAHLWNDIERAIQFKIPLLNVASEPIRMDELADAVFHRSFQNHLDGPPARYDFRTKYDVCLNGKNGYLYSKASIVSELIRFVNASIAEKRAQEAS